MQNKKGYKMKQAIGLLLMITLLASCDTPANETAPQKIKNDSLVQRGIEKV